ncbi:unnamed protein product [Camellia sinensis]
MSFFVVVLASLVAQPLVLVAQPSKPTSDITVVGAVYCDTCYHNTFSSQSYFLPGVDVHVECKFKANSPKTTEQITFSVNRTTNRYGVYKLEIPSVEGVDCVEGPEIQSFCESSLIQSTSPTCNVPGLKSTTNEVTVKSKQTNLCIYSLSALSFRPQEKNITLCEKQTEELEFPLPTSLNSSKFFLLPTSLNSSKFFLPYFPPYGFPWPPLPQFPPLPPLPPLPQLPPFPKLPFPPLPPLPSLPFPPLPFPNPSSSPFPFPPLPRLPPFPPSLVSPPPWLPPPPRTWIPNIPFLSPPPPPPPAFNLRDPKTWFPNNPSLYPPPPPAFNLRDPRTWIPNNPFLAPPPPPEFNLRDPRTWIPYIPPTPPSIPQNQQP